MKRLKTLAIAIAIVGNFLTFSIAQNTDVWTGDADAFYDKPTSWLDGSPATVVDDALFDRPGSYIVRWDSNTGNTASRSITVENGDATFLGQSSNYNHLVLNGTVVESNSSLVFQEQNLTVQENMAVSGLFAAIKGSIVSVSEGLVVGPNVIDDAEVLIEGDNAGTVLNVGGSISTGQFGDGAMTVSEGASVNLNGNMRVGFQGTGFVVFQDPGTKLTVVPSPPAAGQIVVGGSTLGVLDFVDGASGTAEELVVTGNGIVELLNNGSLTTELANISGSTGFAATVVASNGHFITGNEDTVIGDFASSNGLVWIQGPNGTWTANEPVDIGRFGNGELRLEEGGSANIENGISRLGEGAGSNGMILVTGTGSQLSAGNLDVGFDGNGTMRILDGGTAATVDGYIGLEAGAGTVEVSGAGSTWDTGLIPIGLSGQLNVLDGGTVFSTGSDIELGEATVVGAGSCWMVDGTLNVEPGGSELRINGGVLNVAQDLFSSGNFADIFVESNATINVAGQFTNGSLLAISGNGSEINATLVNDGVMNMNFGSATVNGELNNIGSSDIQGILTVNGIYRGTTGIWGNGSTLLNGEYRIGEEPNQIATHQWKDDDNNQDHDLGLMANSTTIIEIAGNTSNQFDRIIVDGFLGLQGSLEVHLTDGFELTPGQQFLIIQTGMLQGTFAGLPEGAIAAEFEGAQLRISYLAGDGNDIALIAESTIIVGDVSGDGEVNLLDVQPFVDLLSEGGFSPEADINGDGVVDLLDVAPFIELLAG